MFKNNYLINNWKLNIIYMNIFKKKVEKSKKCIKQINLDNKNR